MPEDSDPGKLLRGGQFYSPLQARLRTDDVLLSELRQPCARQVPRHEHELAVPGVEADLEADLAVGAQGETREREVEPGRGELKT